MLQRRLTTASMTCIACFLILASCDKKSIDRPCTQISDLLGKAVIVFPNHEFKDAFTGMMAPVGSKITVAPDSRIVLSVSGVKSVAAPENAIFCIDSFIDSGARKSLSMRLFDGRLFCTIPVSIKIDGMPVHIQLHEVNASMLVRYGKDSHITVVKTLDAAVSITLSTHQTIVVPSCCKALISGEGAVSRPLPLNDKDFADIEPIMGKAAADSIIGNAACPQTIRLEPNEPPQWVKSPNAEGKAGKVFLDTLAAKDPEGSPIRYRLLSGPKGMSVDERTGILRCTEKKPGLYGVEVAAMDSTNLSANMTYELSVAADSKKTAPRKHSAVISAPGIAAPAETVTIDASRSATSTTPLQTLSFRFDVGGEVIGDHRAKDGFGKQSTITHAFKTEGTYTVHVRVRDGKGQTAHAQSVIVIRIKPVAAITVSPKEVFVNKECILDASQSIVGKSLGPFMARWDLDNNGSWDYPFHEGYTNEKTVKKTWAAPGIYPVVLEIKDHTGSQAWASVEIEVKALPQSPQAAKPDTMAAPPPMPPAVNGDRTVKPEFKQAIVKASGPYQTHVGKPLTLKGGATAEGNRIVSFAWDFNGDGVFDTSLTTTGKVKYTYRKAGTFKAVLKVATADSKEWFDTAEVSVVNTPPTAHAGKDFFAEKGHSVKLKGSGDDPDDGIALYEWDFNGDGAYEWSSPKSGMVEHAFDDCSQAILRVSDHGGAYALDTVRVVVCPEDMVRVEEGVSCIDKYEWPNKKGLLPNREMTYDEAEKKCSDAGKRLCSGNEWEKACAGRHNLQYPKSNAPPNQNCNVIGNRAFSNKVAPSGSFSDCESPAGAYDMNGNVAEWTAAENPDSAYVYGGSWHNDLMNAACSSKLFLKRNTGYFYVGFRCCK